MGIAIAYTYSLIDLLAIYVNDGRINIDNNLIENAICPLALGRKNWLFCGNDAPAYRTPQSTHCYPHAERLMWIPDSSLKMF